MPENDLQVRTTQGLRDVAKIILHVELWYELEQVPVDQASYLRYTGPGGVEFQRSEFSLTLGNLDMKMAMQGEKDGKDVTVEGAVRFNKPANT